MLKNSQRRDEILKILKQASQPVPGTDLAQRFQVSRQVIVQDIAILRASDEKILPTARGYMMMPEGAQGVRRVIAVSHGMEGMRRELELMVDMGAKVLNVIVEHDVYGSIQGDLMIENRRDVDAFMDKIENGSSAPLYCLTSGDHYHTIEARDEETLAAVEEALMQEFGANQN